MTYIPRYLEKDLLLFWKTTPPPWPCLLLSGARQCGKTTLLVSLYPKKEHIHINLAKEAWFCQKIDQTENFEDFTFLIESQFQYKMGGDKMIIIDEAQLSKKLGAYVRFFKETWQAQKIILTGSTLSSLFDKHEKPTGRVIEFVLRPFNFTEFLCAQEKKSLLEKLKNWTIDHPFSTTIHTEIIGALQDYLIVGGLPEIVLTHKNGGDYQRLLANLYNYYKRDFENKLSDDMTSLFEQCFKRIAAATGSQIKNASIVKSSSPGYRKLPVVLSLLEKWHLILKVEIETSKLSKIGTMTPKRYLFDHGIRMIQNPSRSLSLDLANPDDVNREELRGLIENFVLTEMLSQNPVLSPRAWFKDQQAGHVDFLFFQKNTTYAIEVKASIKWNQKHTSALKIYSQNYPQSKLILCDLGPGGLHKEDGLEIFEVPAYALASFLKGQY